MNRDQTSLPHEFINIGRLWNSKTQTGNFDNNRAPIDMIVIHTMAGTLKGSTAHFLNPKTIPSAHYGIGWNGELVQWLPESVNAYHAGVYEINRRSIGIEHEDVGNVNSVRPDALYETSSKLVAEISLAHSIPLDREHVRIHREFKATQCPGNLDVDRIIRQAQSITTPAEGLNNYQMKPSEFIGMVTKSSEYDELFATFGLNPALKVNVGSHKLIIDEITRRINDGLQSGAVRTMSPVITNPKVGEIPTAQSDSIWKMDVSEFLRNILSAVKVRKP